MPLDASSSAGIEANLFQPQWMLPHESRALLIDFVMVIPLLLVIVTRGRPGYLQVSISSARSTMSL